MNKKKIKGVNSIVLAVARRNTEAQAEGNKRKSSKSEMRFTAGLKLKKLRECRKEGEKEERKWKRKEKEANPEKGESTVIMIF